MIAATKSTPMFVSVVKGCICGKGRGPFLQGNGIVTEIVELQPPYDIASLFANVPGWCVDRRKPMQKVFTQYMEYDLNR